MHQYSEKTTLQKRNLKAVTELNMKLAKILLDKDDTIDSLRLGAFLLDNGWDKNFDGFWIWEVGTDIEYFSPRFRESLGYKTVEEFPNKPESWQKCIDPYDKEKALHAYAEHLKDESNDYHLSVTYTHKDGTPVFLVCAGNIVNRGDEKIIMVGTHKIIK